MASNRNCLNGGISSLNNTCICQPCFMGNSCDISVNVIKFSLTYVMRWDIDYSTEINPTFNVPQFLYTSVTALMTLLAILNNALCLNTLFLQQIRWTNSGMFQIFYCITGLSAVLGLQLRMMTMLWFDFIITTYAYRFIACNLIPVFVIIMGDTSMLISSLVTLENVLLESFNFNPHRSRRFSVITSIASIVLTAASHLHEMIARRPSPYPNHPYIYGCTFVYALPLDIIDKVLRVSHVIIPLSIHFVGSFLVLVSITRRALLVRSQTGLSHTVLHTFLERKHMFVLPVLIILANFPHLLLHLKDDCEDARDISLLRTHVSFNVLNYVPPTLTYFIYIYPAKHYHEACKKMFRNTWFKLIRRKKMNQKLKSTRTTASIGMSQETTNPSLQDISIAIKTDEEC